MSCPKDMIPYVKAHTVEIEERDMHIWEWTGAYGISALVYSLDHMFNGKKAKTEYPKTPIVEGKIKQQIEENNIVRQREEFVRMLETMQRNFNLNKQIEEEKKRRLNEGVAI